LLYSADHTSSSDPSPADPSADLSPADLSPIHPSSLVPSPSTCTTDDEANTSTTEADNPLDYVMSGFQHALQWLDMGQSDLTDPEEPTVESHADSTPAASKDLTLKIPEDSAENIREVIEKKDLASKDLTLKIPEDSAENIREVFEKKDCRSGKAALTAVEPFLIGASQASKPPVTSAHIPIIVQSSTPGASKTPEDPSLTAHVPTSSSASAKSEPVEHKPVTDTSTDMQPQKPIDQIPKEALPSSSSAPSQPEETAISIEPVSVAKNVIRNWTMTMPEKKTAENLDFGKILALVL
jgi:hypothetical protein